MQSLQQIIFVLVTLVTVVDCKECHLHCGKASEIDKMRRGQLRQVDVVVAPARDPRARALREARRSGVLSLPARGLREFPPEAFHLEDHMDKASGGCLVPDWLTAG